MFLQSINKTNRRKSEFLNKKVVLYDLEWPLRSYLILRKICVFTMLAFIEIFNKNWFINEYARKKKTKIPKSWNPGISESRSFWWDIEELTFLIIKSLINERSNYFSKYARNLSTQLKIRNPEVHLYFFRGAKFSF